MAHDGHAAVAIEQWSDLTLDAVGRIQVVVVPVEQIVAASRAHSEVALCSN